jgi:hypothetical protein
MVLNKKIGNYMPEYDVYFERDPIEKLVSE